MSAGKGDTPRPVDKQKFDEGFDRIFGDAEQQRAMRMAGQEAILFGTGAVLIEGETGIVRGVSIYEEKKGETDEPNPTNRTN